MPDDSRWMKHALVEAEKASSRGEVPVGCVVVFENRIIAGKHNLVETLGDPFAHAEILALGEAFSIIGKNALSECSVYVTVEPCAMCVGAMLLVRIAKVVYGASEPETGACGSVTAIPYEPALKHRIAVIGGVEEEECRAMMKEFFKKRREQESSK